MRREDTKKMQIWNSQCLYLILISKWPEVVLQQRYMPRAERAKPGIVFKPGSTISCLSDCGQR